MTKETVKICEFTIDSCTYKISQPVGELDREDYKNLHKELSSILYE